MRRGAACLAGVSALLLLAGCRDGREDRALAAAIDAQLAPHVQSGDLSGAVVAGREDRVIYARGFLLADAEQRTPFTPDTPVPAGALAETVTAAATWLLAEEGRLELDAPVQRYLPRFPWPGPTLRHLLSHSAGLPEREALAAFQEPDEEWSGALVVELLRRGDFAPSEAPGALFTDGSVGHDLLIAVIESVEHRDFEEFAHERLLDRADVRALAPNDDRPPRALSYRREAGWLKPDPVPDAGGFHDGGGLQLSALELYRWCSSFYADPGLREETLERGSAPALLDGGRAAADQLGWTRAEGGRRFRMALMGGHTLFAYRDEARRQAVVFVSNTAMPAGVRPRLARALVQVLEGRAPAPIEVPAVGSLSGASLEAATGLWALPVVGEVEIAVREGAPEARLGGGPRYRARRVEDRLRIAGVEAWLGFDERGEDGFHRMHWTGVFDAAVGTRAVPAPTEEEVP